MEFGQIIESDLPYSKDSLVEAIQLQPVSCAGYLGHPFEKIGMLCMIDQVSLPKHVRCEYNERDPCCSYASSNAPISPRRGSMRALCLHLNEATSMFQLSRDPRTFFALDQTSDDPSCSRNAHRSDQRKIRTACGKRPVTTAIDHSPSTDQATSLPEN